MLLTARVIGRGGFVEATVEVARTTAKFPNVTTTGPRSPLLLKRGSLTVELGQSITLTDVDLRGSVTVRAGGSLAIRGGHLDNTARYPVQVDRGGTCLLEDFSIRGNTSRDPSLASNLSVFCKGSTTLRRVRCYDVGEGPRIEGDDMLIEDSLIHELVRVEGGHHDCIQVRAGNRITIRRNTLQAYNAATDDPMNAAVQFGSWTGDVPTNVLVEGNWMDGGNQTINGGFPGLTVRGNTFGEHFKYGLMGSLNGATWVGNVREDGSPAEPVPFAAPLAV